MRNISKFMNLIFGTSTDSGDDRLVEAILRSAANHITADLEYPFADDIWTETMRDFRTIERWLRASVKENEKWFNDVNSSGIPKTISRFKNLKDLVEYAKSETTKLEEKRARKNSVPVEYLWSRYSDSIEVRLNRDSSFSKDIQDFISYLDKEWNSRNTRHVKCNAVRDKTTWQVYSLYDCGMKMIDFVVSEEQIDGVWNKNLVGAKSIDSPLDKYRLSATDKNIDLLNKFLRNEKVSVREVFNNPLFYIEFMTNIAFDSNERAWHYSNIPRRAKIESGVWIDDEHTTFKSVEVNFMEDVRIRSKEVIFSPHDCYFSSLGITAEKLGYHPTSNRITDLVITSKAETTTINGEKNSVFGAIINSICYQCSEQNMQVHGPAPLLMACKNDSFTNATLYGKVEFTGEGSLYDDSSKIWNPDLNDYQTFSDFHATKNADANIEPPSKLDQLISYFTKLGR